MYLKITPELWLDTVAGLPHQQYCSRNLKFETMEGLNGLNMVIVGIKF